MTILYARSLSEAGKHQECLESILLQYAKSPHYAGALLYQYGKYAMKSVKLSKPLFESAVGALKDAMRCSTSKRQSNCLFYIGLAYERLGLMQDAYIYFNRFSNK